MTQLNRDISGVLGRASWLIRTMNYNYNLSRQYFSILLLMFASFYAVPLSGENATAVKVNVGVILDAEQIVGKMTKTCMSMALEDFYGNHPNYTTKIVFHTRDSKSDVVGAASAAIDVLKNVQVQAIIGPQKSTQAAFVIDIGTKAQVPIISPATSPSLSPRENPYFIRSSVDGSSQVEALAAIIQAFNWREVALIYEDDAYGRGIVPYLTDALVRNDTQVRTRSFISPKAGDDHILEELYKLKTMPTRVFLVHMLPLLASRFFLKVKEVGMMSEGYAWIITDGLTNLLDTIDPKVVDSMQGVLGLKPYVPRTSELEEFNVRWRKRFRRENPEVDRFELNVFGLWAYDSVRALAMAVERVGISKSEFKKPSDGDDQNSTDLTGIGTSEVGAELLRSIRETRYHGLSGEFRLVDGELKSSTYRIVNVIGKGEREIGFWTEEFGLSRNLTGKGGFGSNIMWPGESNVVPKGWEIPTSGKKLRVGVPVKGGFVEFIDVENDPQTHAVRATGFCVDVFKEVMEGLDVRYEFQAFETPDGQSAGSYDELILQIPLEKYDIVVGDITIVANRSNYVDFTLPYTESGVAMVVPIKDDDRKNAWVFTKPLTMDLWLTSGIFFVFTGFVIWVLEHRLNKKFRGPPSQQVGMMFWFSFSTLVFAHREKVISNLTRFVVIVWVFVVMILTNSYTANLTSMLTVQKLQPTVTGISDLIKNGDYVGYQDGSFIYGFLQSEPFNFNPSKLRNLNTFQDYDEALSRGRVAAIIDELPYLRIFLAKYCSKYIMVGPTYRTAGFGFAFPKGSPLMPDVSRAILRFTEGDKMNQIQRKWFGEMGVCEEQSGRRVTSGSLTFDSFKGLFLIAGTSSLAALIISLSIFLLENREVLNSNDSIWEKVARVAKKFDEEKNSSSSSKKTTTANDTEIIVSNVEPCYNQSPPISIAHNGEGNFSQDEGFSTTEPGTPSHEHAVEIVEIQ